MANFCSQCGTPLTPNQKFCGKCGQQIEQHPGAPSSPNRTVQAQSAPVRSAGSDRFRKIGILIGAALLLIVMALVLILRQPSEKATDAPAAPVPQTQWQGTSSDSGKADPETDPTAVAAFMQKFSGVWIDMDALLVYEQGDTYFQFYTFENNTMLFGAYVGEYGRTGTIVNAKAVGNCYTLTVLYEAEMYMDQHYDREFKTVRIDLSGAQMAIDGRGRWVRMGSTFEEAKNAVYLQTHPNPLLQAGDTITVTGVLDYMAHGSDTGNENCWLYTKEPLEFRYEGLGGEFYTTRSNQVIFSEKDAGSLKPYVGRTVTISGTLVNECHGLLLLKDTTLNQASSGSPRPWVGAYLTLIHNANMEWDSTLRFNSYSLYDIDQNGIPELFLKIGSCEADYQMQLYTFDTGSGSARYITYLQGGHCVYGPAETPGQFVQHYGHMGQERIIVYNWDGKTVSGKELVSRHTEGDYYNVSAFAILKDGDWSAFNQSPDPAAAAKNSELIRKLS